MRLAHVSAIVAAGGSGERFGRTGGKQLARIAGLPVVSWSLRALDPLGCEAIVVVCDPSRVEEFRSEAVEPLGLHTTVRFAPAGATRQDSVASGIAALPDDTQIVLVHDGARPLLLTQTAADALWALADAPDADGVVVAHPSVDTVKLVEGSRVSETPAREQLWAVQTPQIFRAASLRAAHDSARRDGFVGTDDAALVERQGGTVLVFEGPRDNIKITMESDVIYAEAVLAHRAEKE